MGHMSQRFGLRGALSQPAPRAGELPLRLNLLSPSRFPQADQSGSPPLFGLPADPRPISPTRAVSPNAPFHSRILRFTSDPES